MKASYQHRNELHTVISNLELADDFYAAQRLEGQQRQEHYRHINDTIRGALAGAALHLYSTKYTSEYSAFVKAAQEAYESYSDNKEENPVERLHTGLYALLPDYIDTLPALTHPQYASREQQHTARTNAVHLNHLVREAIDNHTGLTSRNLIDITKRVTYHHLHNRGINTAQAAQQWDTINKQLQTTINGIRHEVAFEEMMHSARDIYDCRQGSDEEDAQGIDYIVTRKSDNKELYIDVKASEIAAQEARHRQANYNPDPRHLTLATGLTQHDFPGGSMRASPARIRHHAASLQQKIDTGFTQLNARLLRPSKSQRRRHQHRIHTT